MNALIYFLVWAGIIFVLMRFGCGAHVMGHGHRQDEDKTGPSHRATSGTSPTLGGGRGVGSRHDHLPRR